MKKIIIFILAALVVMTSCSNEQNQDDANLSSTDDFSQTGSLSEDEAEGMVKKLIYFGILDDGESHGSLEDFENYNLPVVSKDKDYEITLANGMILTMDKNTGIIHCIEYDRQKNCLGYVIYLDGAIIIEDESVDCKPLEPHAALNAQEMVCKSQILEKYASLKDEFSKSHP